MKESSPTVSQRRFDFRQHPLNREIVTAVLLLVAFLVSAKLSPFFLDANYLLSESALYIETALLALPLKFIILSGNIDISVASTLALTACATAVLTERLHIALPLAIVCGLLLGAALGFFNGLLVVRLKLPSLAVTLGTFALYRGIAQILVGDKAVSHFPEWFASVNKQYIAGLPVPLLVFLVCAILFGVVLHRTVFGRWIFAIGTNQEAARYSGVPVDFTLLTLFTLAGLTAAVAGVLMTSRTSAARFDMGLGLELKAITAVVLGGTDIFGGRGTVAGTTLALALIAILGEGMGLADYSEDRQKLVIGLLLLGSILLSNLLQRRRS